MKKLLYIAQKPSTMKGSEVLFRAVALALLGTSVGTVVFSETVVQVTQMSYDDARRPACVAVRMDPNTFSSLPTSACTATTPGNFGPDRISKNSYFPTGRVEERREGVGTEDERVYARYTYTDNGLVATETDANGNMTTLQYDGYGRLSRVFYPSKFQPYTSDYGNWDGYDYDGNGNQTWFRRRDGNVIRTEYDNLNRPIKKWHDWGSSLRPVHTTYDLTGKVIKRRFDSWDGPGTTYYYDSLGRMSATTDINGRSIWFGYNQASARTVLVFPDNRNLIYSYDGLNRVVSSSVNGTTVGIDQHYNDRGELIQFGRANNTATLFQYDAVGRLSKQTHHFYGHANQDVYWEFAYSPASQIKTLTTGYTEQYSYKETVSSAENRTYNGLNQDAGIAVLSNGYDARGNLTNDGSRQFVYDLENRLQTVGTYSGTVSFSYDPEGRLAGYSVLDLSGASTIRRDFLYDGTDLIAEYDGNGVLQKRYLHGVGMDSPWAETSGSDVSSLNVSYLYSNYQGSIFAVANGNGNVTDIYKYGPYGEPKNALDQTTFTGTRFRYTGQTAIPEAQLYYYKARIYDPMQGRFLQTDPIGSEDDLNLYAYTGGDPINGTDPDGTQVRPPRGGPQSLRTPEQELRYQEWQNLQRRESRATGNESFLTDNSPGWAPTTRELRNYRRRVEEMESSAGRSGETNNGNVRVPGAPTGYYVTQGSGRPKPAQNFSPTTNEPQNPPPPIAVPNGWEVRVMGPTQQYPNGYWRMYNDRGQAVDPSTMRPPSNVTRQEFQARTHVPLPGN